VIDPQEWASEEPENQDEVRALKKKVGQLERLLSDRRGGQILLVDALREILNPPPDISLPTRPRRGRKKREEVAVLHVSDTQIGKATRTYNTEVAKDRLLMLARKTCRAAEDRRQSAKIDRCCVFFGGDLIEGETIFPGQQWEIEAHVLNQAVHDAPGLFAKMLQVLAEGFHTVEVYGVAGNHGRSASVKFGAHPKSNWDIVAMETTKLLLGNASERIQWHTTTEWYQVINILGWACLLTHGDKGIRGHAGFPWYGVGRAAAKWFQTIPEWRSSDNRWRQYLWIGHFHTYAGPVVFNNVTMLANGTTESDNEYALMELASAGEPCQRLAFFDEQHGLVADHQVFLGVR